VFPGNVIALWSLAALAAVSQASGWPALSKTLLTYGFAARIPVAVVMFFAMQRRWGTHYDSVPPQFHDAGLFQTWLWLGFFGQLIFWVGYTVVAGMLFGCVAGTIARAVRRPEPNRG
jgi:hypothetical protein